MPDDQTVLYSLLGVLLILLAVLMYNNQRAKAASTMAPSGSDEDEGDLEDPMLLKFVRHEGSVVGETVARDGDKLILKKAGVFKAVPLAAAAVAGDEVVLEGDIDWDAAKAAGMAWHEANTAGHDPEVTEHLTRSEDVKHPALEATKDEEE